jgi:hypothetical protein
MKALRHMTWPAPQTVLKVHLRVRRLDALVCPFAPHLRSSFVARFVVCFCCSVVWVTFTTKATEVIMSMVLAPSHSHSAQEHPKYLLTFPLQLLLDGLYC